MFNFGRSFGLLVSAVLISVSAFATPSAEKSEQREFLANLGFNDVPAIISERLAKGQYTHELNRRQMKANIVSYEVLNAARELSILILDKTQLSNLNDVKTQKLALFAAKMLALKPIAPATDYPSNILSLPQGEEREIALVEWLHEERVRQMNAHKLRLLSDISTLLFGERIIDGSHAILSEIDGYLATIVDRMYVDDAIGNGRYFGRALTALLLRAEKLHGRGKDAIEKTIATELRTRYNLRLENFIGDTMVINTGKGEERQKIENGTMMLSRNLSAGSLQISWAAIPGNLYDRWRARFKAIIGTPIAAPLYVTPEDTENGIGLWMRIRDRIAQGGVLRMGYSHIVFFEIKEDKATGIKMPRVIDNYPNRVFDQSNDYVRTGGARLVYPEQVIDMSHHAGAYFANPIPEKVKEWSQQNLKENGYQSEFFESTELKLDELTPVKSVTKVSWKTSISKNDFNELHSETNARKLSDNIWKRFANGLEQSVYDGYTFHWPDPYDFYLVSSTYCSQLGDMVMRKYAGMPLERNKSSWHWLLRFFANVGNVGEELKSLPGLKKVGEAMQALPNVKKSMKLTQTLIIAPSSLVLQPFMQGKAYIFNSRTPEQRMQSNYLADDYREADVKMTEQIAQSLRPHNFAAAETNIMLDYGAAMRDFEYGTVMRASRDVKTHGFSVESMAEIATRKAAPAALKEWRECEMALAKKK